MPEKTLTIELTEQEGAILWDLLAQKCQTTHAPQIAYQLSVEQNIMFKINAAAKAAGLGVFAKGDAEGKKTE